MDFSPEIAAIHNSQHRGVLAVTGGGSGLLAELLTVPGASRTVLEALVPYSAGAMEVFLKARPEQFCAESTARKMAVAAWQRAEQYAEGADSETLFGFSITASLATDRPHRGEHRAFMAFHSQEKTLSLDLPLKKGTRTRQDEEEYVTVAGRKLLAYAVGVGPRENLPPDAVLRECTPPESWRELFAGKRKVVCIRLPEMTEVLPTPQVTAILSGSFAPFHHGHARMRQFAMDSLQTDVALELAVRNADKPALDYLEIRQRLERIAQQMQSAGEQGLIFLTDFPYFRQKAAFFPGTTFVVGADTISRIADPVYHGGNRQSQEASYDFLNAQGCRFLVLGRVCGTCFRTLNGVPIPENLRQICSEVPEFDFREDISSTELRERGEG